VPSSPIALIEQQAASVLATYGLPVHCSNHWLSCL